MPRPTLPWVVLLVLVVGCAHGPALTREEGHARFQQVTGDYFAAAFDFQPTAGSAQGLHPYDGKLEDYSAARVATQVKTLHGLLDRVVALWPERVALPFDDLIDLEALEARIRADLLEWETLGFQLQNPMTYAGLPGQAIDVLLKRDFAPANVRLKAVTTRLQGVPALYAAGKANVKTPPREWTDLALIMGNGALGYLQGVVATWAKEAAGADAVAYAEFNRANTTAIAATQDYLHSLQKELLPRSTGSWAIGGENFSRKLLYDEMISEPIPALLAKGEAQLKADGQAFVETARLIDPKKTPAQVMASLFADHPKAPELLPYVRRSLEGVRQFVVAKDLVSFPSEVRPKVELTPPFARNGSYASLDSPGPYETQATEAYYYVTPPEPNWDAKHIDEHLAEFNASMLQVINVHEAYPGHFLQFLWAKQFPTQVRKLISVSSNAEGWAHYAEQMVIEEGFADADPRIKLAQLEEALLRDCRYVVGIQLHTTTLTVEQGAERFVKECYQLSPVAYDEARRGTYDPTYLYYTYGKLEVYELRREYLSQKGGTLRQFHDAFVSQGALPIPLVRKLLLEPR